MRELDEKIGILVDAQIANEGRFAALASSQQQTNQKLVDLRIANEERFAALAESQNQSEQKLAALIDIVSQQANGKH